MQVLLTDLPDAALQRLVQLASTPSTPGRCLISGVSKGLRSVSKGLRSASDIVTDGTVIHLQLGPHTAALQQPPSSGPPLDQPPHSCGWPECRGTLVHLCWWRHEQRLLGLAQWLCRYASQVVSLRIMSLIDWDELYEDMPLLHRTRVAQAAAMSAIADSLVTAAMQMPQHHSSSSSSSSRDGHGGNGRRLEGVGPSSSSSSSSSSKWTPRLRLTELRLCPAGGLTSISNALEVCQGLRQLRLDDTAPRSTTVLGYRRLCKALSSLTHLTALQLADVWVDPCEESWTQHTLDPLFSSCPPSLEVLLLEVQGVHTLRPSSLTHLSRLRQLQSCKCPALERADVCVTGEEDGDTRQQLAGLTCLTMLVWGYGMERGRAMLDLPRLQAFGTQAAAGPYLEQLVGKPSFCKLVLGGAWGPQEEDVTALAQLTQLTELVLGGWSLRVPAAAWLGAFGALSRLECLTIHFSHWWNLGVAAVCKQLAQLRHLSLIFPNHIDPRCAAETVAALMHMRQLQRLSCCWWGMAHEAHCMVVAACRAYMAIQQLTDAEACRLCKQTAAIVGVGDELEGLVGRMKVARRVLLARGCMVGVEGRKAEA